MLQDNNAPLGWAKTAIVGVQWPLIVAAAFGLGRYVHTLEARLKKAEVSVEALVTRHMPAIHRALADIRLLLTRDP